MSRLVDTQAIQQELTEEQFSESFATLYSVDLKLCIRSQSVNGDEHYGGASQKLSGCTVHALTFCLLALSLWLGYKGADDMNLVAWIRTRISNHIDTENHGGKPSQPVGRWHQGIASTHVERD